MITLLRRFFKLTIAVIALVLVFFVGIIGYMSIEDFSFIEALYMTVITISTVGFSEIRTLSDLGRVFTVFLIMSSFGVLAYTVTSISSYIFTGEIRHFFKEKKVINTIGRLENHVIICGYGRNGQRAAEEFLAHNSPFTIIESDIELVNKYKDKGNILIFHGDSREDEDLLKANVDKAKALITTLPDDADNLLTVLTARELNKDVLIISRASRDNTYKKLKFAGADNVIMPDKIGGAHMASLVLKPDVMEFMDQIITQNPQEPFLSEIKCSDISGDRHNLTVGTLKKIKDSGVAILGTKDNEGKYVVNPPEDFQLTPESKLFILGNSAQIALFKV